MTLREEMIMKKFAFRSRPALLSASLAIGALAGGAALAEGVTYKQMADALHAVMESDRTVYTRMVVNRLQNEEKVIKASEHFKDDKALPLPAQMFRFGSEMVAEKKAGFSYSLLSLWPINKQNTPRTDAEKKGLTAIAAKPDTPFYTEETIGKQKYYTAVYPDRAVSMACVTCHNEHKDTPRKDFKIGEVMGGVVIRIPMN
jgi:hypothetical protein